ncbi:MAG: capsular polysaccharide biosynthesis protein [Pseudomonadota bacterium]
MTTRRLGVASLGFFRDRTVRRILSLAGWEVVPAVSPRGLDAIGVWGRKPVSWRGRALAKRWNLPLLTVEDALLRSVRPGSGGGRTTGLILDECGVYFDASAPSRIERTLVEDDLSALEERAAAGIAFLRERRLSKYNDWVRTPLPRAGFVLIVDQTAGDASIALGGAGPETFAAMLAAARAEHPEAEIVIRTHPEVESGAKRGHFGAADLDDRTTLLTISANPWLLLARAKAVYVVTSNMGFEAVMAGHLPVVFGQPFYAGWGLTEDRSPPPRRGRARSVEDVFAAAMLVAPVWYDPARDALTSFEGAAQQLAAEAAAWSANGAGAVCLGISAWKHRPVSRFLEGRKGPPIFETEIKPAVRRARREHRDVIVWAGKETEALRDACVESKLTLGRMEDGFLRSVGLGAALLPAASLVIDRLGIYFDPTRRSDLDALIAARESLTPAEAARAEALRQRIVETGVTKYNVGRPAPSFDAAGRQLVLVPGQVEDDASIRLGTTEVRTNRALLVAARETFPAAFLIYKPHPDVEAGLRTGAVPDADDLADLVAREASAADLLARVEVVWTMTSLMGFEALLRGLDVHCLGRPFYAGWGLTTDHATPPSWRRARPSLDGLVHATLVDYPRYLDPVSGRATTPEVILDRLAARAPELARNPDLSMRVLGALQHRFRRWAHLWRR